MVTVAELLQQALSPGTIEVVGGPALRRRIRRVLLLRPMPPGLDVLRGNELILLSTRTLHILDPDLTLPQVISDLGQGVSALVVEGEVTEESKAAALRTGIAVLQLPRDASARTSEQTLSAYLNARRVEEFQLRHTLLQDLTAMATQGKGLSAVAAHLSEAAGLAVVFENANSEVIAAAVPNDSPPQLRELLQASPATRRAVPEWSSDAGHSDEHGLTRVSGPIVAHGAPEATVTLFGDANGIDDETQLLVQAGATAAAIELTRQHAVEETVTRLHGDFASELLGGFGNSTTAKQRASRLGFDLDQPMVAIAFKPVDSNGSISTNPNGAHDQVILTMKNRIARILDVHGVSSPVHIDGSMTAVFYPVADDASLANIRWVAERFCNDLAGSLPITGYRAGVSRRHAGASEYPAAYREATRTLDLGLALNLPSTVVCHADLGIHRLLLAASASEDLSEMHEELLGALARYDQTTNSDLVPTLAAYLATGNAVEVAKRLNVHRNTLRYRLQRIREITGADLDDPEVRLTLHLALKISDVISVTQRAS